MRVALVHRDLHATTRGGIGTLYRALAPRLRATGHEVALITQHTPNPLVLKGIRMFTLPRTDDLDRHRRLVDQTLAALAPDVVESSSWEAETLHYARRPATERASVVVRGDLSAATMRAFDHLITAERELVRTAEKVLAVSEFAATDLTHALSPVQVGVGELAVASGYLGPADRAALVRASVAGVFPYRLHPSFQGSGAIADYLAHAVPVVATDVANMAELARDAGHIVPSGDPEALAAALDNVTATASLARNAVARAHWFTAEAHAVRCLEIYQQVLDQDRRKTA